MFWSLRRPKKPSETYKIRLLWSTIKWKAIEGYGSFPLHRFCRYRGQFHQRTCVQSIEPTQPGKPKAAYTFINLVNSSPSGRWINSSLKDDAKLVTKVEKIFWQWHSLTPEGSATSSFVTPRPNNRKEIRSLISIGICSRLVSPFWLVAVGKMLARRQCGKSQSRKNGAGTRKRRRKSFPREELTSRVDGLFSIFIHECSFQSVIRLWGALWTFGREACTS